LKRIIMKSIVLALLGTVGIPGVALAYIDPNIGGMLFQALATGLAVFTGLALLFSRQIRMVIGRARRSLRRGSESEDQQFVDGESPSQDTGGE
jgi:hypothetical protein